MILFLDNDLARRIRMMEAFSGHATLGYFDPETGIIYIQTAEPGMYEAQAPGGVEVIVLMVHGGDFGLMGNLPKAKKVIAYGGHSEGADPRIPDSIDIIGRSIHKDNFLTAQEAVEILDYVQHQGPRPGCFRPIQEDPYLNAKIAFLNQLLDPRGIKWDEMQIPACMDANQQDWEVFLAGVLSIISSLDIQKNKTLDLFHPEYSQLLHTLKQNTIG